MGVSSTVGPGFWAWLLMASAVRAPVLMSAVAFTSLTALAFDDADRGGGLAGACVIGLLAGTPLALLIQRRLAPRPLLAAQLLSCALAWSGLTVAVIAGAAYPLWIAIAVFAGLTMSGSAGLVRATMADAVSADAQAPASTIDALSQDALIFLAPVIVAVGVRTGAPGAPASVVVVSALAIALVLLVRPRSSAAEETVGRSAVVPPAAGPWMKWAVWTLFSFSVGMAFGATEAGAVGLAVRLGIPVGATAWFFLILALGSAGGAWLDIAWQEKLSVVVRLLLCAAVMVLGCLLLAAASSLPVAVAGLILIGTPIAPLLGMRSHVFDGDAEKDRSTGLTMAFAAQSIGFAVGTALLALIAQRGSLLVAASALVIATMAIAVSRNRTLRA